jgi:hypothetical protein
VSLPHPTAGRRLVRRGSDYYLELGDYDRYGFLMSWTGDGWYVDT